MPDEIKWDQRPEVVFVVGYEAYAEACLQALRDLAQHYAALIEAWMKTNGSWTDRTGAARQGLAAEVSELVNGAVLAFGHTEDHGFWLEVKNNGRFAIVAPALDVFGPLIMADLQKIFR
jgi:hypothetical protein